MWPIFRVMLANPDRFRVTLRNRSQPLEVSLLPGNPTIRPEFLIFSNYRMTEKSRPSGASIRMILITPNPIRQQVVNRDDDPYPQSPGASRSMSLPKLTMKEDRMADQFNQWNVYP